MPIVIIEIIENNKMCKQNNMQVSTIEQTKDKCKIKRTFNHFSCSWIFHILFLENKNHLGNNISNLKNLIQLIDWMSFIEKQLN